MLHLVVGEEMREPDDEFPLVHSDLICFFFNYPNQQVEYQDGILSTEVLIMHSKIDVLDCFMKASRSLMCSYGSSVHQSVVSVRHQSIEIFIGSDEAIAFRLLRGFETLMEIYVE